MTPRGISLQGCSRAQARARICRLIDEHTDEQVRKIASDWLTQDGATCDAAAFQQDLAELRASFARFRHQHTDPALDAALDELFGPERPAS